MPKCGECTAGDATVEEKESRLLQELEQLEREERIRDPEHRVEEARMRVRPAPCDQEGHSQSSPPTPGSPSQTRINSETGLHGLLTLDRNVQAPVRVNSPPGRAPFGMGPPPSHNHVSHGSSALT